MNQTSDLDPPGLGVRLAAILYDAFLLFAIWWAVTAVAVSVRVAMVGEDTIRASGKAATGGPVLFALLVAAVVLFYGWFWRRNGQTLGMQAWRIKLVSLEGDRPSWSQVLLRLIGAELSLTLLGMGYAWVLIDKEGRAWHDIWSRTRLIRLPKAPS